MTIVRCPRCRDEVSVPAKATGRALVRCPLCLEQYLLAEAMSGAPPALVIIGGEVEQAAIEPAEADGIEYRIAGGYSANDFVGRAPVANSVMATRPTVRPLSRPRKKEKNGLVLLANYVVGGVLGISLAPLVLWWVFGRDPVELGPTVAEYAPWIVPARFHGNAGGSADGATANRGPQIAVEGKSDAPSRNWKLTEKSAKKAEIVPGSEEPMELPLKGGIGGGGVPMPDLRDLLPEGFSGEARPSP